MTPPGHETPYREKLCLVGGGEHARVVAEAATLQGWDVLGCFDLAPTDIEGLDFLGTDPECFADLARWADCFFHLALAGAGGLSHRAKVLAAWEPHGFRWGTVVHPTAFVAPSAHLDPGVFVGPQAVVHTNARIGGHVIVNTGAIVEHDVTIGRAAHLAPGVITGGGATVGQLAMVGLGAVIRDHISVGQRALVGMGAVVIRDVPDEAQVRGNPAR